MNGSLGRASGGWRWSVSAAVVYFVAVLALTPIDSVVRFNSDEGNNLMKARLCALGYELYTDIWSDQPPGLAYELVLWQGLFGDSVPASRVLILLHASLLAGLLFDLVRRSVGLRAAAASAVLLALSPGFVVLSVSVMVGLPALAMGVVSLWSARWYGRTGRWSVLALSGALMALSMSMKLFTGLLVPWIALEAVRAAYPCAGEGSRWARGMAAAGVWLGTLGLSLGLVAWWSGATAWDQLVGTHVMAMGEEGIARFDGPRMVGQWAQENVGLLLMAVIGLVSAARQRRWDAAAVAGWAGSAAAALCVYQPVWRHQLLLLAIPVAWLAGYGWAGAEEQLRLQGVWMKRTGKRRQDIENVALRAAIATAVIFTVLSGRGLVSDPTWRVERQQQQFVEMLKGEETDNRWVVTDEPIYAVWAGKLTSPEIVVMSWKRWVTDPEIEDLLKRVIERDRPDRILLVRHEYSPEFLAWVERDYELRWAEVGRKYYVRRRGMWER